MLLTVTAKKAIPTEGGPMIVPACKKRAKAVLGRIFQACLWPIFGLALIVSPIAGEMELRFSVAIRCNVSDGPQGKLTRWLCSLVWLGNG